MRRRACAYRKSLLASRDGARVVSAAVRGSEATRHFEAELAAMVALGFSPVLALRTITTLSHYINGHVLQEQAVVDLAGPPDLSGLPTLAAGLRGGSPIGDEAFEYGLSVLIAGTESQLGAAPGRTGPSPR